jgi:hypothetical protein
LCYSSLLKTNIFVQPSYRDPLPTAEAKTEVEEPVMPPAETVVQSIVPPNSSGDVSQVASEGAVADAQAVDGSTLNIDDTAILDSYFGANVRTAVVKLYEKVLRNPQAKPGSLGFVSSEPITDRQLRGKLHQVMVTTQW